MSEAKTASQPRTGRPGTELLAVERLSVSYSGGSIVALEDIGLTVHEGEIVALLGVNGAGKTTLLRAISGLLGMHGGAIQDGAIRYGGRDITGAPSWKRVGAGISISLEGRRIFADLSVADNLRAGGYTRPRAQTARTMEEVYELFPVLGKKRELAAGLLSGGEQQMLAVGRALMQGPRLLLLDEPSLGLAPLIVAQIMQMVTQINERGCSVLLIEQNVSTALPVADYAYVLESRRVAHHGPAAELMADDRLRDLYLGSAGEPVTVPREKVLP